MERDTGFEPATSSLGSWHDTDVSGLNEGLTESDSAACTTACTKSEESHHDDSLAILATALLGLSPEQRAKLAALLLAPGDKPK